FQNTPHTNNNYSSVTYLSETGQVIIELVQRVKITLLLLRLSHDRRRDAATIAGETNPDSGEFPLSWSRRF
ncbi:hypothetical protein LINPERPRIM_LOCUS5510, partial [Linum perenne]